MSFVPFSSLILLQSCIVTSLSPAVSDIFWIFQARLNNKMQTAISSVTPKALVVPEADALKAQFMEGRWARRGAGSALFRTLEIWSYAFQFLTKELKVRKIKDLELQKEERMKVAVFCRESLLELGPTFIKFGQVLSTR